MEYWSGLLNCSWSIRGSDKRIKYYLLGFRAHIIFYWWSQLIICSLICCCCCCCSVIKSYLTLRPHGLQHTRFPSPHHPPEFNQVDIHWIGDSIQLSHALSSPSPSEEKKFTISSPFSNESAVHIRWPKYWSFSFSISPSNEGLVSIKIDWFYKKQRKFQVEQ